MLGPTSLLLSQNSVFDLVFDIRASKAVSLRVGFAPQRASPPPPRRWRATALLGEPTLCGVL